MKYVLLGVMAITIDGLLVGFSMQRGSALLGTIAYSASALLWAFLLIQRGPLFGEKPSRGTLAALFLYLLLSGASQVFWFLAVEQSGVAASTLVINLRIPFLVLVGVLFQRDSLNLSQGLALAVLFLGVTALQWTENLQFQSGLICAFIAMLGYGGQKICNKYLAGKVNYSKAIAARALVQVAFAISLLWFSTLPTHYDDRWFFASLILASLFGSVLAKKFDFLALETVSLSTYSAWQSAKPAAVFILSVLFLGEIGTFRQLAGGVLVLFGLWYFSRSSSGTRSPARG